MNFTEVYHGETDFREYDVGISDRIGVYTRLGEVL